MVHPPHIATFISSALLCQVTHAHGGGIGTWELAHIAVCRTRGNKNIIRSIIAQVSTSGHDISGRKQHSRSTKSAAHLTASLCPKHENCKLKTPTGEGLVLTVTRAG